VEDQLGRACRLVPFSRSYPQHQARTFVDGVCSLVLNIPVLRPPPHLADRDRRYLRLGRVRIDRSARTLVIP